jgi:excisionase family DNA binding protein
MTKLLYRTSEAKAALGCGTTRLYELINNGTLEARRFGKRTYITADSLEAFVASLKPVVTPTMAKAQHQHGAPEATCQTAGGRAGRG